MYIDASICLQDIKEFIRSTEFAVAITIKGFSTMPTGLVSVVFNASYRNTPAISVDALDEEKWEEKTALIN